VQRQATRVVLDTVGCMIAGSAAPPARPLIRNFERWAGPARSDVLGTAIRTSPPDAAFVNAYTADVLDFEETLLSHPGAVVVAAGLAVGQDVGATGAEVLTAIMTGYEVGTRLGRAMLPSPGARREHAVEFWWKPVAAAVTAGLLLRLDRTQWIDAFGYATAASPVPRRGGFEFRPLSYLKANYGGQAQVGVQAAYFARDGFRTYRGMLDGPRHFSQLLGSDRWRPDVLLDGLGARWECLDIGFKRYPVCLYLHALLESVEVALAGRPVPLERVREIRATVPSLIADELAERCPRNIIDAQFSAPFAVAALLSGSSPNTQWFSPQQLSDPDVLRLAATVDLQVDSEYTRLQRTDGRVRSGVRITLDDGSILAAHTDRVRGSADRPLTDTELVSKFVSLVSPSLGRSRAEMAAADIREIADRGSIDETIQAVRPS